MKDLFPPMILAAVGLAILVVSCETIGPGSGHNHYPVVPDAPCDTVIVTVPCDAETVWVVCTPDTVAVVDQEFMDCVRECSGPPFGNRMWDCIQACFPAR